MPIDWDYNFDPPLEVPEGKVGVYTPYCAWHVNNNGVNLLFNDYRYNPEPWDRFIAKCDKLSAQGFNPYPDTFPYDMAYANTLLDPAAVPAGREPYFVGGVHLGPRGPLELNCIQGFSGWPYDPWGHRPPDDSYDPPYDPYPTFGDIAWVWAAAVIRLHFRYHWYLQIRRCLTFGEHGGRPAS